MSTPTPAAASSESGAAAESAPVSAVLAQALLMPAPAPGFVHEAVDAARCVYVSNVSYQVSDEQLQKFLGYCGEIVRLHKLGALGFTASHYCVQFGDETIAQTALGLNDLELIDRKVHVQAALAAAEKVPELARVLAHGFPTDKPLPLPIGNISIPTVFPTQPVRAAVNVPKALRQRLIFADDLPPQPSGNPTSEQSAMLRQDEIDRTLYTGNIGMDITPDQLILFFKKCGPVTHVRLSYDAADTTKYAFVEFATRHGATRALNLNGKMLGSLPIKVNRSKNPIVKPQPTAAELRAVEAASRRIRVVQDDINARIARELRRRAEALVHAEGASAPAEAQSSPRRERERSRSPERA